MNSLLNNFFISCRLFFILTILTGMLYPLAITGIAQKLFPHKANGSLIVQGNIIRGSELIGQYFVDPTYFFGRPSATLEYPYNASASAGSNLGPTNKALVESVKARIQFLRSMDPNTNQSIPRDILFSSGSGLDPHISVEAAHYQVSRIARLRGISEEKLYALIAEFTEEPIQGIIGRQRVNVLKLNLMLDQLGKH